MNRLPGVEAAVNLATERAQVTFQPRLANIDGLIQAVDQVEVSLEHGWITDPATGESGRGRRRV